MRMRGFVFDVSPLLQGNQVFPSVTLLHFNERNNDF